MSRIKFLLTINPIIIYLLYILFILLASFFFCEIYSSRFNIVDDNNNIILKNITFGHGQLIHNIFYSNIYYQEVHGTEFYLKKTLALPFLIILLAKISLNFFFIISTKNFIVFSLYFWIVNYFKKINKKNNYFLILILLVPLVNFYNFQVSLNFNYEDCLSSILLPILYLLCISRKTKLTFVLIAAILFVLYFVKTSMFFVVFFIPIVIIITENKNIFKWFPLFFSFLAILIWGIYGLNKTDRFPISSTGSSFNSFVMSYAFNNKFRDFYPHYSTDLIPVEINRQSFHNEWDFYDYYNQRNKIYLKNNLKHYSVDFLIKLKFIFFNIYKDGSLNIDAKERKIDVFSILNKIIINVSILYLIIFLFKIKFSSFKLIFLDTKYQIRENLYLVFFILLSLAPHLVVWATSKHLVAISNISLMYILFSFKNGIYLNEK